MILNLKHLGAIRFLFTRLLVGRPLLAVARRATATHPSHTTSRYRSYQRLGCAFLAAVTMLGSPIELRAQTVARQWNEALLDAIRIDFPAPTVHARNLYHTSAAMYDAWTVYDSVAGGHFNHEKQSIDRIDTAAARNEAISYAAYRVLSQRYQHAVDPTRSQAIFDDLMGELGYDPSFDSTIGNSPAAIGNRIANNILTTTLNDGSNEANAYVDPSGYIPMNDPMVVEYPSVVTPDAPPLTNPNRWQPLFLSEAVTQNDLSGPDLQTYVGPHWGSVTTFAMGKDVPEGQNTWSAIDPGAPPKLNGIGDAEYRSDTKLLIEYSNSLDPTKGPGAATMNISPRVTGNRPLGTHDDVGYSVNPATNQPYADNVVKVADYGRILAEFWADGPDSETPPGHWNVLANEISSHPDLVKRIGGSGHEVDDLEWDVKLYLALNGAVHDGAIAAWGTKRQYDYVRPITKIRYQANLGQSTDSNLASYHPDGIDLEADLIELITAESIAPGGKHRNAFVNANQDINGNFKENYTEAEMVGKIAVMAWNHEPDDPANDVSGTDWILAENWVPYQDDNFVTPAFAAYVSGHSTFSRAAAEVMAAFTGSEYFPGGLGEATFDTDYLDFEDGPTEPVTLQWATYFDAADEAGISRLWGGIHVPVDDFAGRIMGSSVGIEAMELANDIYVDDDLTWYNRCLPVDVSNDEHIVPRDALLVINELNNRNFSDEATGELADLDGGIPRFFYDTTNDGIVSPRDALLVINRLIDDSRAASAVAAHRSVAAVPEPSSAALLVASLLSALSFSRRR